MISTLLLVSLLAASDAPPADLPACPSDNEKPEIAPLIARTERVMDGKSSVAVMKMNIKTPSFERAVKMKVWSKGRDFALVKVVEGGARDTGMMTLKREKQLWNYLPQAGRVMKLPSGMMGDSWMGSDFTNDDLVKGSSLASDFEAKVEKVGEHDGRKAWFITLTPKANANVVWGRVEMILDRESCLPLEQRFFDEDNKLARRMQFGELKKLGWRTYPMKMTVTPAEAGRQTIINYESVELDGDVPEDTFSLRRLQSGKD
ncbi:MAG: outer membrane lipoprotein-sorting protein [Archangium sp.]